MLRPIAGIIIAAVLVLLMEFGGVFVYFGAHPFWSANGVYIGIAIGAVFYALAVAARRFWHINTLLPAAVFLLMAIGCEASALILKENFAASYAENVIAGRGWYLSHIGFVAAGTALLASLFGIVAMRKVRTTWD